jgi:hypothetical protein
VRNQVDRSTGSKQTLNGLFICDTLNFPLWEVSEFTNLIQRYFIP